MKPRTEPTGLLAAILACAALAGGALLAETSVEAGADAGWRLFRGDPQLTGRSRGDLPRELEPLWTFQAGEGIESTAAVDGNRVYVSALDGHLYALELASGTLVWKYQATDEIKSSPSVSDGVVYFGDEAGTFHAVDAKTGKARWTFQAEASIASSANFAAGRVLFGSHDNFLYAVSTADGSLAWKLETQGYVHGTPAVVEKDDRPAVISAGCDGFMRLVSVADGKVIREVDLASYVGASPAVVDDRAYVGTFENQVLGVDLGAGTVLWRYENPERQFPFFSSAAVGTDFLVVGGRDKMVHALALENGEARWRFPAGSRVDASPVLVGDRALIASTAGLLAALDVRTGEPVWKFETGTGFLASPAVAAGRLIIGDLDGRVFCFGGGKGPARRAGGEGGKP